MNDVSNISGIELALAVDEKVYIVICDLISSLEVLFVLCLRKKIHVDLCDKIP